MCELGGTGNLRRLSLLLALIVLSGAFSTLKLHFKARDLSRDVSTVVSPGIIPGVRSTSPLGLDTNSQYFERQVRPIFQAHCVRCHGADKQRGGLRVDSLATLLKGGEAGSALVP